MAGAVDAAHELEAQHALRELIDEQRVLEAKQNRTLAVYGLMAAVAHATAWWLAMDAWFVRDWSWFISALLVGATSVNHGLLCWRTVQALRRGKAYRATLEAYLNKALQKYMAPVVAPEAAH